jgi:formylglycine-generating enzyme required for sulfatase activity
VQEREKARADGLAADLDAARRQVGDAEARVKTAEAAKQKAEDELAALRRTPPVAAALDPGRTDRPLSQAELVALKPGNSFKECPGCPEMVVVPKGEFLMGSPADEAGRSEDEDDTPGEGGKQVPVKIGKPFAVGKFEVTFDDWEACVNGGGCQSNKTPDDRGCGRGKHPVMHVAWNDAQEYVAWLNSRVGGGPYRLLSEAEWEYAARSSEARAYSWGADIGKGNANCDGCGSRWDNKQTAPVGSFKPNRWGLYDMHGNVWEWVQDCYADSLKDVPRDGSASNATKDCRRVLRGGSWNDSPGDLRSAYRNGVNPGSRVNGIGFRVSRTLNP